MSTDRHGAGRDLLELGVEHSVRLSLRDGRASWPQGRLGLAGLERVHSRGGGDDVLEGSHGADELDGGYGGAGRDTCDGERRSSCERRWIFRNP